MTEWRKDPEFSGAIKRAGAQRLLLRLEGIEAGEQGWQGTAWSVERRSPRITLSFLGRMSANKNPVDAIRIAQAVRMPIMLAGAPQNSSEEIYFQNEVQPLIDNRQVRYVGRVNHEQRRELLRKAAAFLFPTSWAEPFGIVLVEALASGLPVLAYNNGAVPEIIDQGVTGFYANSVESLAAFVPQALALDRKAIRDTRKSASIIIAWWMTI